MVFLDNFERLCKERGMSQSAVMESANVSHSMLAKWKAGASPSNATLAKLAKKLDVSIFELDGTQIKKPATTNSNELSNVQLDMLKWFNQLPEDRQRFAIAQIKAILELK